MEGRDSRRREKEREREREREREGEREKERKRKGREERQCPDLLEMRPGQVAPIRASLGQGRCPHGTGRRK